jgi:integrase
VDVDLLRKRFQERFPLCLLALRLIDADYRTPKRGRGFSLLKRESKKRGFQYYVRYMDEGRMLPSMWNTHTNIREQAEAYARENRDRIVAGYKARRAGKAPPLYATLETFFGEGSESLRLSEKRNGPLGDSQRRIYDSLMKKRLIPFLRKEGIRQADEITGPVIARFQEALLGAGLKPQTINGYFGGVSRVLSHFVSAGILTDNPYRNVKALAVRAADRTARGCHEIGALKGVFRERWEDGLSYLLCLLIYTTDMRNSEIERTRMSDIIEIADCRFIRIGKSKTASGTRLVPLHPFVNERIREFAAERGLGPEDLLIPRKGPRLQTPVYRQANREMGKRLGMSGEELDRQGLTYYSGRHYWKTLMNSEGLGSEIEEVFMGHQVSSDVAKRYNHRDKQGRERLLRKAREVTAILDRCLL